jgi:siderophore ferric iron reductase
MTACCSLAELFSLTDEAVPGLRGSLCSGADRTAGGTAGCYCRPLPGVPRNQAALRAMTAHWMNTYPEAGVPYSALRCWGLLIWQPVYVMVVAAHLAECCPSLDSFSQPLTADGFAVGYLLDDHVPFHGRLEARLVFAAKQIETYCRDAQAELSQAIRLNPIAARCLLADCVLAALLAVRRLKPEWDNRVLQQLGKSWLNALDLSDASAYFPFRLQDGSVHLALARKTCCYNFRCHDGDFCSTCPRLRPSERVIRLNAEHEACAH